MHDKVEFIELPRTRCVRVIPLYTLTSYICG